mgnify:CR=1 FL=1
MSLFLDNLFKEKAEKNLQRGILSVFWGSKYFSTAKVEQISEDRKIESISIYDSFNNQIKGVDLKYGNKR